MRHIIGVSRLQGTYSLKATIVSEAVELLKLNSGGRIVFFEDGGRIYIEKG